MVHFYAFLYPLLPQTSYPVAQALITFAFSLACIWLVVSAILTMVTDPVDDAVLGHGRKYAEYGEDEDEVDEENPDTSIYCYECEVTVHRTSKHCRRCNKCVPRMDHHCVWLNTCVGAKNYPLFLNTVAAVTVVTTMSLALSLAFTIESFATPDAMTARINAANAMTLSYGGKTLSLPFPVAGVQGLSIISVVLLAPLIAVVYQVTIAALSSLPLLGL